MPRLSSKSASIDQTFKDLYTLFWTGSDESKYSAFLDGMAVAFYIEIIKNKYIRTISTKHLYKKIELDLYIQLKKQTFGNIVVVFSPATGCH